MQNTFSHAHRRPTSRRGEGGRSDELTLIWDGIKLNERAKGIKQAAAGQKS